MKKDDRICGVLNCYYPAKVNGNINDIGITIFKKDGILYWANDSQSLKGVLGDNKELIEVINEGMKKTFKVENVKNVESIGKCLKN